MSVRSDTLPARRGLTLAPPPRWLLGWWAVGRVVAIATAFAIKPTVWTLDRWDGRWYRMVARGGYLLVYRTKAGLAMRAIEEDEETARMLGVNANRVASLSVALGFVLAALAGAFVAPIYSLTPGMGLEPILMSFLIIIVGGLGSITGTVLAGLLVGVLQSVGGVLFGAEAAYGIVFVVMIAVLVVRPAGLLGQV